MTAEPTRAREWRQPLRAAAATLAAAGIETAASDAELLAAHVAGLRRGELALAAFRGDAVSPENLARFEELIARRSRREPLQHLTGSAPFRHLTLAVGPGVFVPRPETEILAGIAIDALRLSPEPAPVAVDLGSGSGAIALAMATEVPHARVFAVEKSDDAVVWTRRNAAAIAPEVSVVHGDLADTLADLDGTVSVVASNPPYIPDDAIPRDPEVRDWDPPAALYGGVDGLDIVRVLSRRALALARPGGLLAIEHAEVQGAAIREVLAADGWRSPATHPDLTLRDRVTTAYRP